MAVHRDVSGESDLRSLLVPIFKAIGMTIGPRCEVVLHEIRPGNRLESSIARRWSSTSPGGRGDPGRMRPGPTWCCWSPAARVCEGRAGFLYDYLTGDVAKGVRYGNAFSALKQTSFGDFNWATLDEVQAQIAGAGPRIVR